MRLLLQPERFLQTGHFGLQHRDFPVPLRAFRAHRIKFASSDPPEYRHMPDLFVLNGYPG
jgi:hypothetical protein